MTEEINRNQVMDRRFALVEEIAILSGKHKAELEPLNEALSLCERFIKESMLQANEQQVKTANGHMAYFIPKDSVKVGDWDVALAYIKNNNAYHLLNQALNKTAVKEHINEHKEPPPGAEYVSYRDLAWKRGKG
jgi:hypothetical protein